MIAAEYYSCQGVKFLQHLNQNLCYNNDDNTFYLYIAFTQRHFI